MRVFLITILAMVLHILFGWAWTAVAALAGGIWTAQVGRCMWMGAVGVGLEWAGWIALSFITAAPATQQMLDTLGGLMGNSPAALVVGATVCIGVLLGALGGLVGGTLGRLIDLRPSPSRAT